MGKAKGIRTLNDKEPIRKVAIVQIEYDSGELYWDRMGRVVRQLCRSNPSWLREGAVGQNKTTIVNPTARSVLEVAPTGSTVTLRYDRDPSGIEDEELERFSGLATSAINLVADELEVEAFEKVAYREHYFFPGDSVEDVERWIQGLGVVTVTDEVFSQFGKDFYALSFVIMVAGDECRNRIEVKGIERSAEVPAGASDVSIKESQALRRDKHELLQVLKEKRNRQLDPMYAAVLDIESFLWDRTDTDFDIKSFVTDRAGVNLDLFRACVAPKH